jgi:hypothetical protein
LRLCISKFTAAVFCTMLMQACSSEAPRPSGASAATAGVDFSGAWEVDYSQSDNIRDTYESIIRDLRRQAERRQRGANQGGGSMSAGGGSGGDIYALARMAEVITDIQLLDIDQNQQEITVKREGSFALMCEFHAGRLHTEETPLGKEVCGWDGHQLVFQIYLPDGLSIFHRMTLGPEGKRLNMATTVRSDQVTYPFTLDRVFNRYDPNSSGFRCKQTLTRGRVCTTEAPEQ